MAINTYTTIDYDELNAELRSIHAGMGAAECHGFISGYFCYSNSIVVEILQDLILAGVDDNAGMDEFIATLAELANQTANQILDDEISFNLLLPDDESSMSERTNALAEWCAGFVSGLGIGGIDNGTQSNPDCEEFIKDLISISKMETFTEENESAENDLFEIIEYVRIGVIMLHQEWHHIENSSQQSRVLH
ncbi:MAG: YecA family protein [Proteobacteria bacterium]|nr:YecA family protein [Pseudomonadota bacterium]